LDEFTEEDIIAEEDRKSRMSRVGSSNSENKKQAETKM